jgi:DNA-binding response OmpR family regulator
MKLLIIEDEPTLLKDLGEFVAREGFLYELAHDYSTAEEKIMLYDYDCVILDINLPDGSGFDILKKLRQHQKLDGVLILSARDSIDDKMRGFELGADDYLTKPFFLSELNARVRAIIRRKKFNTNKDLLFGNIVIDLDQHLVKVDNEPLNFTKKEFAILTHLISNQKRVVTKTALSEYIWGDYVDEANSFGFLFSQIKNLKRKLKEAGALIEIDNIYGVGYQIKSI